jgi:hypothetical protein
MENDQPMKKTAAVESLVREVLESLPRPYTENVIEDVFLAIEKQPGLRARYDTECASLTKTVTNNWVGQYVSRILGKVGMRQVDSTRSKLAGSYSVLDSDARTVARKPDEDEALQLMASYYKIHKDELPERVRDYRDEIVDLIKSGMPAAEAFAFVLRE